MTENLESVSGTLEKLIPTSLDNIIRTNRNQGRLAIASNGEIAQLAADVPDGRVKHDLTHWQVIVLHVHFDGTEPLVTFRLTGRVMGTGQSWITSQVLAVDLRKGLVRTANSLYRIHGERVAESELDLIFIAAALNTWGIGRYFGVPEFFF